MVCLVTLFLGLGFPSGMVVCYGANGHVAIEARDGGCPAQAKPQASESTHDTLRAEQPSMASAQQGNTCTDIPLTLQFAPSPSSESSLLSLPLEAAKLETVSPVPLDIWMQPVTIQQHSPHRLSPPTSFLNSHRTVVLRI